MPLCGTCDQRCCLSKARQSFVKLDVCLRLQELCPTLAPGTKIVINLSGRGDKDVHTAAQHLDISGNIDEEIKDISSQRNM